MSEFKIIKQAKKGNIEKAAIMGGVAFYTKFKEPAVIYDEKDLPKAQQKNFEWTVEIVVDEDTADGPRRADALTAQVIVIGDSQTLSATSVSYSTEQGHEALR